jgi:chromosomal replication initiator protein
MQHDEPVPNHDQTSSPALTTLWNLVCTDLSLTLGQAQFDRWFSEVRLVRLEPDHLWLGAPNAIYTLWIEENYLEELKRAVAMHLPTHPPIRFEIAAPAAQFSKLEAVVEEPVTSPTVEIETVPAFPELVSDPTPAPKASAPSGSVLDGPKLRQAGVAAGLSEANRFENFIVGHTNRLAAAAAKAVAEKPGKTYHPLFIYSASGLGKTHLLQAIGWESLSRRPRSKVIYITAEKFANDYIEALQKNNLVAFRKRFREADMLLIDDVQFFSGKEGMQAEFFHTFNSLTDRHKQIVLASDCPASEIRELEDRLVSRFRWGMTAEIAAPDRETRLAILRQKREERGARLPDWVCDFIAERVTGSVRALEGALIRVATIASLNGRDMPLAPDELDEALRDFVEDQHTAQISVADILTVVSEHYGLTPRDLTGKRRTSRLVEARHIGMYLARELTGLSLAEIGKDFGGRDHGTVINAVRRVTAKIEANPATRRTLDFLRRSLLALAGPSQPRRRTTSKGSRFGRETAPEREYEA